MDTASQTRARGTARPKTTRHKGITRIDRPAGRQSDGRRITASRGYMVRVRWQGINHQAWFTDSKHGDRLGALAAALEWRDATERRVGKPRTDRMVVGKASNNTGVVGVGRRSYKGHTFFEVAWHDETGKPHRTKYSIDKHGEKRALTLAKQARRLGETARLQAPRER